VRHDTRNTAGTVVVVFAPTRFDHVAHPVDTGASNVGGIADELAKSPHVPGGVFHLKQKHCGARRETVLPKLRIGNPLAAD